MLTRRALNRALLARQGLLQRHRLGVEEAVGEVLAIQAQEPVSPYLSLWSRIDGFRPEDLDEAFASARVTKATLFRLTLHAVRHDDLAVFHRALQPMLRGRLAHGLTRRAGVTAAHAAAVEDEVLAFLDRPRSNAEVEAWLDEGGHPGRGLWWALRGHLPVRHAATGGPWSFGLRPAYVAAASAPSRPDQPAAHEALTRLVRRYLGSFGPASPVDFARFTKLPMGPIRAAFAALSDQVEILAGPDGKPLHDLPDAPRPAEDTPAPPRLLPMWDSVLLAHDDRTRIVPEAYRGAIVRSNGDTLATVLVDGFVAGVWRPVAGGTEVTAFETFDAATWAALADEAALLEGLLAARERTIHTRYHRWFADVPAAQVRVLG